MSQKILVIFDVDGTLVEGKRAGSRCFANCYEKIYNKPFPSINWAEYPHVTDTTIFGTVIQRHFNRQYEEEELQHFHDSYAQSLLDLFKERPDCIKAVDGATTAIEQLAIASDIVLGVATGGWKHSAQIKLDHVGIPHDNFIFYGADGHTTREQILNAVIAEAQNNHEDISRTVYIGDAIWDVTTTKNLGLPFVGIRTGGDTHVLLEVGARHVVTDYLDYERFWEAVEGADPPG